MKANEIIILSYINKFHSIDLYEIQKTVNEPLIQLVNTVEDLFQREYIQNNGEGFWEVTGRVDSREVSMWDVWTWEYKEKKQKEFDWKEYRGEVSEAGFPVFDKVSGLNEALQLSKIDADAYHCFALYSGEKIRMITAPGLPLKERQRWILKHILENVSVGSCVHGFVKGRSIKTNAECHVGKKEILCLDMKDFFPSIHIEQVKEVFTKIGYSDEITQKLAELCTCMGVLPQGAPTSPYIANVVFGKIDDSLMRFADKYGLVYTRYADDLTFSSDGEIEQYLEPIIDIVQKGGFKIQQDKTHVMKDKYRKMVTGLLVNQKVRVPAAYKKKLRQEIYYCSKYGISQHLEAVGRKNAVNFREYLYGKAYYIKMIEEDVGEKFLEELDALFSLQ